MHYVIGDVHGCYDEMMALLNKIESKDKDAQFIFVGDFIDRGTQVDKVLEWCFENISQSGKYQSVRGNHEQLAIEWYEEWLVWWKSFGRFHVAGNLMPESEYDFFLWMDAMDKLTPEKLAPYIEFFQTLPLHNEITIKTISGNEQTYCIVHAFYDYTPDVSLQEQEEINLWCREYGGNSANDVIVVHGHTPTITKEYTMQVGDYSCPGMICYRKNDINLDGGCVYSVGYAKYPTFLCAICLETLEEIYSCSLEERFASKGKDETTTQKNLQEYREKYCTNQSFFRTEILKRRFSNFPQNIND